MLILKYGPNSLTLLPSRGEFSGLPWDGVELTTGPSTESSRNDTNKVRSYQGRRMSPTCFAGHLLLKPSATKQAVPPPCCKEAETQTTNPATRETRRMGGCCYGPLSWIHVNTDPADLLQIRPCFTRGPGNETAFRGFAFFCGETDNR